MLNILRKLIVTCVCVVLSTTTLLMAGSAASGAELDKVKLRLGWTFGGTFAAIYLGVDKGFYKEQGIDLEVLEGRGTVASAATVGNGTDDFGFFDMSAVARLIDKGLPLKGIAQIKQVSTMVVMSLAKTGITKPKDLEGRILSHPPGDSTSQIYPAFVKKTGIDINKVKIQGLDSNIFHKALADGQVDAILGNEESDGLALKNQGHQLNMMKFSDYGVNIVAYGFATRLDMIKNRPDLVKRFVAATVKSYTYTVDHIDEAVAIGKKKFPEYDSELLRRMVAFQPSTYGDALRRGHPIGWVDESVWKSTVELLHEYMGLTDTNVSRYFTNEFIPSK